MKNKYCLLLIIAFILVIPYNVEGKSCGKTSENWDNTTAVSACPCNSASDPCGYDNSVTKYITGSADTGSKLSNINTYTTAYKNAINSKANDILKYRTTNYLNKGFRFSLNLGYHSDNELYAYYYLTPGYYIKNTNELFISEAPGPEKFTTNPTYYNGFPYSFGKNYNNDNFPKSSLYKAYPMNNGQYIYVFGIKRVGISRGGKNGSWNNNSTPFNCKNNCSLTTTGLNDSDVKAYVRKVTGCSDVSYKIEPTEWYGNYVLDLQTKDTLSALNNQKNPFKGTVFESDVFEFMKKYTLMARSASRSGSSITINNFETCGGYSNGKCKGGNYIGQSIKSEPDAKNTDQRDFIYYLPYVVKITPTCNDIKYCQYVKSTPTGFTNSENLNACGPYIQKGSSGYCKGHEGELHDALLISTPTENQKKGKDSKTDYCYLTNVNKSNKYLKKTSISIENSSSLSANPSPFIDLTNHQITITIDYNAELKFADSAKSTDEDYQTCKDNFEKRINGLESIKYEGNNPITISNNNYTITCNLSSNTLNYVEGQKKVGTLVYKCTYSSKVCPTSTQIEQPITTSKCSDHCSPIDAIDYYYDSKYKSTNKSNYLSIDFGYGTATKLGLKCQYTAEKPIKVAYHQISLENPFAGKDGTGERKIGDNWDQKTKDGTSFEQKYITESIDNLQKEPMYTITLNRDTISEIRNDASKDYMDDTITKNTYSCETGNTKRICMLANSLGVDAKRIKDGITCSESETIFTSDLITKLKNKEIIKGRCVDNRDSLKCE